MGDVGELLEEWDAGDSFPLRTICEVESQEEVEGTAILQAGVYALCRGEEVVYVGKAKILLTRIYAHFNAMDRAKWGKKPLRGTKGVVFNRIRLFPCDEADLDALERALISRFCPRYNDRMRPKVGTKMTLEQVGFDITRLGVTNVVATPMFRRRI